MLKQKLAWITDSTAFIPPELAQHPDLFVMPLGISFGEETFEDGVDLSSAELYQRIRQEKTIPKTSQPSLGKFHQLFDKLKNHYDHAIAVLVSGELSGTVSGCQTAAENTDLAIEVVDSKSMSYGITTLINEGLAFAQQGLAYTEIAARLRRSAGHTVNYILLGNLDQFYKGGRMSGTQYLLGNILQIKPIIHINPKGEFALFDKVRSEKNAIRRVLNLLTEAAEQYPISQVQIMHGNVAEKAAQLKQAVLNLFPHMEIVMGEISSTIAVHAGEGTLALIWQRPVEA